jgi:hypothetical protein
LERRGAVFFVHPTLSPDPGARRLGLPDSLIDFTADNALKLFPRLAALAQPESKRPPLQ